QRGAGLMKRSAVLTEDRDILAQAVDAFADEPHVGGDAFELVCQDGVQPLVFAPLDHQPQLRQPRPQRLAVHRRLHVTWFRSHRARAVCPETWIVTHALSGQGLTSGSSSTGRTSIAPAPR